MYTDTSKVNFIPKSPVTLVQQPTSISGTISKDAVVATHGIGLIGWLGVLVLTACVIGAGGLFLYVGYFQAQKVDLLNSLKEKQKLVDTSFIASAQALGARIGYTKELLKKQVYVSPVFEALHQKTLPSVQFDSFNLVEKTNQVGNNTDNGQFQAVLKGKARSYEVIAQQSDVYATSPILKTHFFSDFTIDTDKSLITFQLAVDLPAGIGHENDFNQKLTDNESSVAPGAEGAQPSSLRRFIQLFNPQQVVPEPQYEPEPEQLPPLFDE